MTRQARTHILAINPLSGSGHSGMTKARRQLVLVAGLRVLYTPRDSNPEPTD